jgi:hypothetical protein
MLVVMVQPPMIRVILKQIFCEAVRWYGIFLSILFSD